jgi:hypothetical protein
LRSRRLDLPRRSPRFGHPRLYVDEKLRNAGRRRLLLNHVKVIATAFEVLLARAESGDEMEGHAGLIAITWLY